MAVLWQQKTQVAAQLPTKYIVVPENLMHGSLLLLVPTCFQLGYSNCTLCMCNASSRSFFCESVGMILNTPTSGWDRARELHISAVTDIKCELEHHVLFVKDEETLIHEARQYDAVIRIAYSRGYSKRLLPFSSTRLILLMPTYIHNSTFP